MNKLYEVFCWPCPKNQGALLGSVWVVGGATKAEAQKRADKSHCGYCGGSGILSKRLTKKEAATYIEDTIATAQADHAGDGV